MLLGPLSAAFQQVLDRVQCLHEVPHHRGMPVTPCRRHGGRAVIRKYFTFGRNWRLPTYQLLPMT
jgi:hypothetical protein